MKTSRLRLESPLRLFELAVSLIILVVALAVHFDNRRNYRHSQETVVKLQQILSVTEASLRDRLVELRELRAKVAELQTRQH